MATIVSYSGPDGEVTIPTNLGGNIVTQVGDGQPIFGTENSSVTSVVVPDSVTKIAVAAFQRCISLESVTLGSGVTSIETSAFMDCSALTHVNIPNNVRSIGTRAFLGCSSLTSVIVGSNVTTIDSSAFILTPNLTSILFRGSAPSNSSWASGLSQNSTIYYLSAVVGWPATYGGRATQVFQPAASGSGFAMSTGFHFSWTNTGSIPMNVRRATSMDGPWTVVSSNNSTAQFVDPNPPSGKAFYQAYLP